MTIVAFAASTTNRRGQAATVVRIIAASYSAVTASTASTITAAWPRALVDLDRVRLHGT
ncbi:MAG TPA: hypothetical protein VGJ44_21420 [Kribbellaceae bacterium]